MATTSSSPVSVREQLTALAESGDTNEIQKLASLYGDGFRDDSYWGSPLVAACGKGHVEAARLLLSVSNPSESVLEAACASAVTAGFADLAIELVTRGARPHRAMREAAEKGAV